jgi:hypothetical protein
MKTVVSPESRSEVIASDPLRVQRKQAPIQGQEDGADTGSLVAVG